MFFKINGGQADKNQFTKREAAPSVLAADVNVLGNVVSEGVIDFDGRLDGNVRCKVFTLRKNGVLKGDVSADAVFIYGKVKGIIKAAHVHLYASCHVEGIVMHETLVIEDGAFLDGKIKRTDKSPEFEETSFEVQDDEETDGAGLKVLENIRLISG